MPKLSQLRYGHPVDAILVMDEKGRCNPWSRPGEEPEDAIHVTYDPGYYTRAYASRVSELVKDNDGFTIYYEAVQIIKAWDVMDGDSTVIALDEASLERVPVQLLRAILNGITEDMKPGEDK